MAGSLARGPIAATAQSIWSCRIFYQDEYGDVLESIHDNGTWSRNDSPLFYGKPSTPLAVVSWDEGREVRVYCVNKEDYLEEWCSSDEQGWFQGSLTGLRVRVAPDTSIAAINWEGSNIRVYVQEADSSDIQEYYCSGEWNRGVTLPAGHQGTSIAAAKWLDDAGVHIRVYYQTPDLLLQEHGWDGDEWYQSGFSPGEIPPNSPITAVAWLGDEPQIRVYYNDAHGSLAGHEWVGEWRWIGEVWSVPPGSHLTAIEWGNGRAIRVYYQDDSSTVLEACHDGGSWSNGAVVASN
ncbi:Fucose-specific lectin [Cladobotryum mycophilum]|uniref:Fucose-specific lectin n=1 Tax=Cladobotryum mycophilum TaxID=491253 RepID=A0ABR0S884_9HYPO